MKLFTGIIKGAKRAVLYAALATKKFEDQNLTQMGLDEAQIVRKYEKNSLANDLLNGRSTQRTREYKTRFYKILEEADRYSERANYGLNKALLAEGIFQLDTEGQMTDAQYESTRREGINKVRDKSDNYEIENIIPMKKVLLNDREVALGGNPLWESNIRFFGGEDEVLINDELLSAVHIKNMGNDLKMIDIFFTYNRSYSQLFENLKHDPQLILCFDMIALTTGKYQPVINTYSVQSFYKMIQPTDGKVIYKLICRQLG